VTAGRADARGERDAAVTDIEQIAGITRTLAELVYRPE
jgi:hypothetical protein